jgi:hypothetical protein
MLKLPIWLICINLHYEQVIHNSVMNVFHLYTEQTLDPPMAFPSWLWIKKYTFQGNKGKYGRNIVSSCVKIEQYDPLKLF